MEIKEELLDIDGIKKSSKPLIDLFIRRTAVLTSTSEFLCEKIIKDQWKNANKLTQASYNIAEIDFCNLGSFYISPSKARKRVARLEKAISDLSMQQVTTDDKKEKRKEAIILSLKENLKTIKFKTKQITAKDEN
jgi:hypothetical protein